MRGLTAARRWVQVIVGSMILAVTLPAAAFANEDDVVPKTEHFDPSGGVPPTGSTSMSTLDLVFIFGLVAVFLLWVFLPRRGS